jgi:predicted glycoside hydrolase/deacetylase ChbG (UPF0249 family)
LINVTSLIKMLAELPSGFTELGCHPGYADGLRSMYRRERLKELKTLCDPKVRNAMADMSVSLCTFRDAVSTRGQRQ